MKNRIISFIVIIVMFFNQTLVVKAIGGTIPDKEPTTFEKFEAGAWYILAQLGSVVNGDLKQIVENTWELQNFYDNEYLLWEDEPPLTEDGNVVFSDKLIDKIELLYKDATKTEKQFILFPTRKISVIAPSEWASLEQWRKVNNYLETPNNYIAVLTGNWNVLSPYYFSDISYFAVGSSRMWGILLDMQTLFDATCSFEGYDLDYVRIPAITESGGHMVGETFGKFYSSDGKPILLFKNSDEMINYTLGFSNMYQGTPRYDGGDMVIPKNVSDLDYDSMYDAVSSAIQDSVALGTPVSSDDITSIVDSELELILGEIGGNIEDIETGVGASNTLLKKILDMLTSIKNALYFNNIIDGTNTAISLPQLLVDLISGKLEIGGEIVGGAIGGVVEGIGDVAGGFLDGLFDGWGDDVLADEEKTDEWSDTFSNLGSIATQKFPFSLPWDLFFLINILNAEPKAPYFEIPVVFEDLGINESIVIDLSQFEPISKLVRSLLALLWSFGLIFITKNMIREEGR